ncbi:MAG: RNA polymerase sigma factor [Planctomycetes bacterium]|nr:RNA polymerase sigma factor [Planctomycetota bacterium]
MSRAAPDAAGAAGFPPDFPPGALKDFPDPEYRSEPMGLEATRLMLQVQRGDDRAFDTLVEGLRSRAYHVARSMVGSPDDALELTQEAFLKVYKARATFREGERFLPWFHRILRNTCFSFLRGTKRARSLSAHAPGADDDAPDFEIEDGTDHPAEDLLQNERSQAFWTAFKSLSARDREMLALRHFKELSYLEIASHLGIPEGTVMSRLFHARKRLREKLSPELFEGFLGEIGR